MPFSITCPSCSAKLKTASAIPIGRGVKCPKCSTSFPVSKENMREVDESSAAVPAPRPAPVAARSAAAPARNAAAPAAESNPFSFDDAPPPPKKKAMPLDDEEDDAPKARKRRVEDEEDEAPPPPKRKRRDDDDDADDDRPRSKSKVRSLDDDDDDRPRSKRRPIDDEDEDESPRARRRRDDDDDFDDDRPRKPKKKKKKSNLGLKIGVIAAGLLALAGVGFLIYYLMGGGGTFDEEMVAYLPGDSKFVAGVEVSDILSNGKLKDFVAKATKKDGDDLIKMANDKMKPSGVTLEDISRVVVGGADPDNMTFIVKAKKSFDKAKAAESMDCTKKEKKGETEYWSDGANHVIYFPSDTLMVGTTKKHFDTLTTKEKGKVEISADLQEMGKKMSKGQLWVALSKDALPPGMASGAGAGLPELSEAVKTMKGVGFWVKADGETISLGGGLLCGSSDVADKAASAARKKIDEEKGKAGSAPAEVKGFADSLTKSISVSNSGSAVEFSAEFKLSDLEPMVSMFGGALGGGIPGFGGFGGGPQNNVPPPNFQQPPNMPKNQPINRPPTIKKKVG